MGNKNQKQNVSIDLTHLDEKTLAELSKKTKLSQEEITNMHREFIRDCPNGKLDKKQFAKIYKELYPFGDATKFCNICFMAYDKDRSGYIDFVEFINGMSIVSKGNVEVVYTSFIRNSGFKCL
jgi:Ca2+-binding EF-hand superfamily protein